jgi:putative membrane protein
MGGMESSSLRRCSENIRLGGGMMAGRDSGKLILILLVAIVVIVVVGAFSMVGMMGGYGWGGMMGPGMMGQSGIGWWMPVSGLIFLILLIVGWYPVFGGYHKPAQVSGSSAIEILKERYAKGEISEEQYQKMKKELE